jgi:hypothetical protein
MRRRTFLQAATALATFGITGCTAPEGFLPTAWHAWREASI